MAKKKELLVPLPRLRVFYKWCNYSVEAKDWLGQEIEVEVVTIHLNTGNMRVRSIEKIEGQIVGHDYPLSLLLEKYDLKFKPKKS